MYNLSDVCSFNTSSLSDKLYHLEIISSFKTDTFNADGTDADTYSLIVTNSTFNGWTSYAATIGNVKFTNCNFNEGSGYAFCRPYNACVFENCEFSIGFQFDTKKTDNIVFKNCTYNGVKITAENAETLSSGETIFFYNGVGGVTFE